MSSLLTTLATDSASVSHNEKILKERVVPDIDPVDEDHRKNGKEVSRIVHSNNKVHRNIISDIFNSEVSCNTYCVPLLVLVCIVTVSILGSLCCDIFKNKKMNINIVLGCAINIVAVLIYFSLCQTCRNENTFVQLIVSDILPWVIYALLIGLVFLYICNRVIKK